MAIVALGWNHRSGLVASAVGALAVGASCSVRSRRALRREPSRCRSGGSPFSRCWPASPARRTSPRRAHARDIGIRSAGWRFGRPASPSLLTFGLALTLGPDYDAYRAAIEELVQGALKSGLGDGIEELPGLGANTLSVESIASFMATYSCRDRGGGIHPVDAAHSPRRREARLLVRPLAAALAAHRARIRPAARRRCSGLPAASCLSPLPAGRASSAIARRVGARLMLLPCRASRPRMCLSDASRPARSFSASATR